MTNKEAIKYLIIPVATSTEPSAEYLKQKEAYDLAIKALDEQRPTGKWIYEYDDFYHCSRCGHVICTEWGTLSFEKYFPFCHCGADMRKGEEE